ncbi:KIF1-binding protein homolog [Fopius arisanus]|uniref:KIF-binding protein n=1 Tax=Fopius arisanus TaxID=64838 RepID=A0A9R1TSQ0_9HYME|nr:PREDICTED: KIF1-binding protein homolog [Fopius arisanus]
MEILGANYEILSHIYAEIRGLQKLERNNENIEDPGLEKIHTLIDEGAERVDNLIKTFPLSENLRLLAMKVTLLYEKSKRLVCEDKQNLAEEVLASCLLAINEFLSASEIIFLALRIINHYSYLLMKREDNTEARKILELGDSIYRKAKLRNSSIPFFTTEQLFSDEITATPSDSCNKLERLVTNNLAMLSIIYEKLEMHEKFAECQHGVLERQFDIFGDELPMWAIKSSKLACVFMAKGRFKEARNHLAAASQILSRYEEISKSLESSSDPTPKSCLEINRKLADVANCWVKYGLTLFSTSKMNVLQHLCHDSTEMLSKLWDPPFRNPKTAETEAIDDKHDALRDSMKSQRTLSSIDENESSASDCHSPPLLLFEKLELSEYEDGVPASLIDSTEEARILFHHTHTWLKRVKLFYTLQEHPMEYVNTIMDLNELYRYLAFYEEDIESQYAVHKLRADALETLSAVLREITPQCYMAVSVEILRELAEVQMEMMGLNLRKIYAAQTTLPDLNQTVCKIETLHDLNTKLKIFKKTLSDLESPDEET